MDESSNVFHCLFSEPVLQAFDSSTDTLEPYRQGTFSHLTKMS